MAGRERGDLSDDAKCNPQNRRCSRAMFSNVDKKQCSRRSSAKPSFGGRSLADAKAAMVLENFTKLLHPPVTFSCGIINNASKRFEREKDQNGWSSVNRLQLEENQPSGQIRIVFFQLIRDTRCVNLECIWKEDLRVLKESNIHANIRNSLSPRSSKHIGEIGCRGGCAWRVRERRLYVFRLFFSYLPPRITHARATPS